MTRMAVVCAVMAAIAGSVALTDAPLVAQGTPQQPTVIVPLRVTVVISRYQGETRKSNLPYTLLVNAGDRGTNLRIGSQVPIPTRVVAQGNAAAEGLAAYNYQSVGVSIDCSAAATEDGRYRLSLTVNDSSVTAESAQSMSRGMPPTLNNFTSTAQLTLRDGETVQYTTAADKVTGETLKIDVTVNVLK